MDKSQLTQEFNKIVDVYGASTRLGITRTQLGNLKRSPTIKNMLYVLYLADKLQLKDGLTTEEK